MADQNEEKQLTDAEKQANFVANLAKLKLVDLSTFPYRMQEQIVGTYTREDLKKYIQSPELEPNQRALRKISRFLYNGASSQYKRLISYFADMLTFDYYVEPYGLNTDKVNKKTFKTSYIKAVDFVETMNIKHEFNKITKSIFKDGIFYGYVHQNKDSFFIQYLDPDYCKITFIQDGLFGFAFNFVYFQKYPERLSMFPEEFALLNQQFENMSKKPRQTSPSYWVNLSFENTICIKHDESTWYPIPPFIGVFEDVLNISDFKALQKAEEEISNYKLLFQKIPVDEKTGEPNKFLITEDFVKVFHSNIESSLPVQVGIITSPMEVTDISFERDKVDKNRVVEATKQLWDEAGVPQILFSSEASGSIGINLSVKTDEAIAFSVLRQMERWVNKHLKENINGTYKFRVRMPEVTWFNRQDWQDTLIKNAQFGIPVKIQIGASLGMQPSTATNMSFLENDILDLTNNYIPLQSSHVGDMADGAGRPSKDAKDLGDAGAKQRDGQTNDNRAK